MLVNINEITEANSKEKLIFTIALLMPKKLMQRNNAFIIKN